MAPKVDFGLLAFEMGRAIGYFVNNCSDFNPKGKTGGVLVYADLDGKEVDFMQIGEILDDPEKYYKTALRKIKQLVDNPAHFSSYMSRDPDNGLWGGGVRILGVGIFAFSGLPELADEACLLKALDNADLIEDTQWIERILSFSRNKIFERLNY